MATPSESEGEIRDSTSIKATPPKEPCSKHHEVDRHTRPHISYASSASSFESRGGGHRSGSRSRSRSPFRHSRSPRGEKRRRDQSRTDSGRYDQNRGRLHDRPYDRERRRSPVSVADNSNAKRRYAGRGRRMPSPKRMRSRSPPRYSRNDRDRRDHWRRGEAHDSNRAVNWPEYERRGRRSPIGRSEYHDDNRSYGGNDRPRTGEYASTPGRFDRRTSMDHSTSDLSDFSDRHSREPYAMDWGRPPPGRRSREPSVADQHPSQLRRRSSTAEEIHAAAVRKVLGSEMPKRDEPLSERFVPPGYLPPPAIAKPEEPEDCPIEKPIDEAALIEARRRKRMAIKAKHGLISAPLASVVVQAQAMKTFTDAQLEASNVEAAEKISEQSGQSVSPMVTSPSTPLQNSTPASPAPFEIIDDQELANRAPTDRTADDPDGPSAADYDPTMDMQEDKEKIAPRAAPPSASDPAPTENQPIMRPKGDFDMFADDVDDDMFAPESVHTTGDGNAADTLEAKQLNMDLLDDWDDHEGYYKIILGELLDGRYKVQAIVGKGVFSNVVRAIDGQTGALVAIKIIRNNETFRKNSFKEMDILQKLREADPEDKKHIIRLERHFEHKNHLCMVFENLDLNLREVLKKFGSGVGIRLQAVRVYAQHMFLALSLLKKCNILHGDLKPDNILVNQNRNLLKIADLGSAANIADSEVTDCLASRFYRAPEIIIGMKPDYAVDMWSIGCTLYELYTAKILFAGGSNNQQLRVIMECRGRYTLRMLKKGAFSGLYFDDDGTFRSEETDLTGKPTVRLMNVVKSESDLRARLMATADGFSKAELQELKLFIDLLDRCLAMNPEKRITPTDALKHAFMHIPKVVNFKPIRR